VNDLQSYELFLTTCLQICHLYYYYYYNYEYIFHVNWGRSGLIVWQLDLQLPVQSVSITTEVVSSNPVHGEVYSIQHYVIKFVSDLQQVGGFLYLVKVISDTRCAHFIR
jgi:hypothetical protein